jgi:hypothetical protein
VGEKGVTLEEFVQQIPDFNKWKHAEKIRAFGWYLQSHVGKAHFKPADINACFDELQYERPSNTARFLQSMTETKPKQMLKSTQGYALERRVREKFDGAYGEREATVVVHRILSDLPSKVPGIDERAYLNEALACFKNKAFRAAIVMAWNLAYDHFERYILNDPARLAKFNAQLPVTYPKADISFIIGIDDLSFLREDQVLTVAKKCGLLSNGLHKVMKEKLERRNAVAHASTIGVFQPTAEECIKDLVENVVLKLT